MKTPTQSSTHTCISNLNSFLVGEISAVETYNQALRHLAKEPLSDLIENRDCHIGRVNLLRSKIIELGGVPETTSGAWGGFVRLVEKGASLISTKTVIAALEQGEDRGLADYRDTDDLDDESRMMVEADLLPAQERTHKRMSNLQRTQKSA
ncbi:MAG: DUF2383 domain-containing protein [Planctomycetota bacterium]